MAATVGGITTAFIAEFGRLARVSRLALAPEKDTKNIACIRSVTNHPWRRVSRIQQEQHKYLPALPRGHKRVPALVPYRCSADDRSITPLSRFSYRDLCRSSLVELGLVQKVLALQSSRGPSSYPTWTRFDRRR